MPAQASVPHEGGGWEGWRAGRSVKLSVTQLVERWTERCIEARCPTHKFVFYPESTGSLPGC